MSGPRHSVLATPDGQWVYSLYLNQTKGPFIHALNLPGHCAMCNFLPTAGKDDFEKGLLWTLTMPADGARLYALSAERKKVLQIDPSTAAVIGEIGLERQPMGLIKVARSAIQLDDG